MQVNKKYFVLKREGKQDMIEFGNTNDYMWL